MVQLLYYFLFPSLVKIFEDESGFLLVEVDHFFKMLDKLLLKGSKVRNHLPEPIKKLSFQQRVLALDIILEDRYSILVRDVD